MFDEAGVMGETDFAKLRAVDNLPQLIRSWVGLDRNAAKRVLSDALADVTLLARQLHFLEMVVNHLTTSGSMDPALLYEPPYTDDAPNGVSDVFELTQVQALVAAIRELEPRFAS